MINLLPTYQKDSISYARKNTKLLNWVIAGIIIIVGMLGIIGAGHLYLQSTINKYTILVEQAEQNLKSGELEQTQARITSLSNNVKLIAKVLSQEVLFSKLLRQTGSVMPEGTILSNIDIAEVEGGIDLVASAKDYKAATQVQVNLQDPENKLFQKVDIVNISCADESDGDYPCTVNLRALFADDNPYLFTSNSAEDES